MSKLLLIIVVIFLVQSMSYAEDGKGKSKGFEENKVRVLGNLDKKLGFLNEFKSCVTSAGSRHELKSCRMTNKTNMEAFRADRTASKEERKKLRAARKEKRERQE
ncbi:MAG: hypothetical protein HOD90_04040 [Nitrospina sp.]|nr:hypothetical protein [Nitrospina sp.]